MACESHIRKYLHGELCHKNYLHTTLFVANVKLIGISNSSEGYTEKTTVPKWLIVLDQGRTTCSRAHVILNKFKLRQPCINNNTLSNVYGYLAERRPSRHLEAG